MTRVLALLVFAWAAGARAQGVVAYASSTDGGTAFTSAQVRAEDGGLVLIAERCTRRGCVSASRALVASKASPPFLRDLNFGPGLLAVESLQRDGVHLSFFALDGRALVLVGDVLLHGSGVRRSTWRWVPDARQLEVVRQLDNLPPYEGCLEPKPQTLVFDWDARRQRLVQRPATPPSTGCE